MSSRIEARPGRAWRVSAALAAVVGLASVSSASAGQLWVGTKNPVTGQFVVRTDGLKQTFPDGTPIGSFAIRQVTDGFGISTGFLLVRRTSGYGGTCQTEATPVLRVADRLYLDLDASVHVVLRCINLQFPDCTSCRIEQNLDGIYCACVNNGNVYGECESRMNDILKGEFILEWALPNPDPTPPPHGN